MQDLRASASTLDFQDENDSNSSSFSQMTQAFSQRIAELQQLVCFRVEDSVKHIFIRDVQGIEASVKALEQLYEQLKQRTSQEMAVLPKAKALLHAAQLQQNHLQHIRSNLPAHLPCISSAVTASSANTSTSAALHTSAARAAGVTTIAGIRGPTAAAAAGGDDAIKGTADGERRRRDVLQAAASNGSNTAAAAAPPRWYVMQGELDRVPSYMRGRLTLEKVNAAVDELVSHAAACHRHMALVSRHQLNKVAAEERQRLIELYHAVEVREAAKGRFWFLETDLKNGTVIRMDKTGKSVLMLLRHLGRLQEVRAHLGSSGAVSAFILQPPQV